MNGAEFERDTALVTGAGSGIGKGAALRLAKGGAFVGLLGRTEDELEETLAEIRAGGGDGMILVADVSQADQMAEAVGRLIDVRSGLQIGTNKHTHTHTHKHANSSLLYIH